MTVQNFFLPTEANEFRPKILGKTALTVYSIILLIVNLSCTLLPSPINNVYASTITSNEILNLTNRERQNFGLQPVKSNILLTSAAYAKAKDMFAKQYWDHISPDGKYPWDFIVENGYTYKFAGENLAKDFRTPEGVHQAWMASKKHRETLLNEKYVDVGIAVVEGDFQGKPTTIVVEMFGNTTEEYKRANLVSVSNSQLPDTSNENILNIKIESPENNSLTNDRRLPIKGLVTNNDDSYSIDFYNGENKVGNLSQKDNNWNFLPAKDWSEGTNEVKAQIINGEFTISDKIKFNLDSTPPQIINSSLNVYEDLKDNSLSIKVLVKDISPSVRLFTENKSYPMHINEEGFAETQIKKSETTENMKIVATDQLGNMSELYINPSTSTKSSNYPQLLQTISEFLNTGDFKTTFNLLFAIGILFIIAFEVMALRKQDKLHERGDYLLASFFFGFIILIGTFSGFSGVIN